MRQWRRPCRESARRPRTRRHVEAAQLAAAAARTDRRRRSRPRGGSSEHVTRLRAAILRIVEAGRPAGRNAVRNRAASANARHRSRAAGSRAARPPTPVRKKACQARSTLLASAVVSWIDRLRQGALARPVRVPVARFRQGARTMSRFTNGYGSGRGTCGPTGAGQRHDDHRRAKIDGRSGESDTGEPEPLHEQIVEHDVGDAVQ